MIPGLVLIHGGAHAADSWDLVVGELTRRAPELRVLAVDLPGRGSRPVQSAPVRIADWVDSVVTDVENARFDDVVIVGHSLAGVTIPGVVAKLGHPRVREAIFVAACVPQQGSAVIDSLDGPLALLARFGVSIRRSFPMPTAAAQFAFWNGMSRDQRKFAAARLYPEPLSVMAEPVDRTDMPEEVARTWILTLRDRSMSPRRQRRYIDELGGVDTVIRVDACHDVMYSHPGLLAAILIERCRRWVV